VITKAGAQEALRRRLGPVATPVGAAAAVVALVSSLLPWAAYGGFPGKMSLGGYPGGARFYVLLLALVGVLFVLPVQGRARALSAAFGFAFLVALLTALFIAYAAGGLVNTSAGAWVAVVSTAVGWLAARAMPADPGPPALRRLPQVSWWHTAGEPLVVAAVVGLALLVFVVGLGIPTANVATGHDHLVLGALSLNDVTNESQFVAFMLLVAGASLAASRTGLLADIGELTRRHPRLLVTAGIVAASAFPFTQEGNGYALQIAASIGVFAAAAVGLNIVVGLAGLLDLGYIAFFGVGAYLAAIVSGSTTSVYHVHVPFGLAVLLGAAVSGLFGILLGAPTLRLRGDYLAIVTLGFGEIFRITANNLDGTTGPALTNGPNGISNIPDLAVGSFNFGEGHDILGIAIPFQANYYWLEIVLVAAVMFAFLRLTESRIGRAWVAIREDELAAAATGINTTRLKLLAFAIGATLAGAAGTVDAHVLKVTEPDSFTFIESATLLAAVILGGMGTVPGALLGATVLYMLPEKLRFLQDLRLLVFGVVLVLLMRFRPEGLIVSKRRAREFHDEGGGADAMSAPPGHGDVVP
jgi:branched-chain amino acid transport system permease protein